LEYDLDPVDGVPKEIIIIKYFELFIDDNVLAAGKIGDAKTPTSSLEMVTRASWLQTLRQREIDRAWWSENRPAEHGRVERLGGWNS
jgi:hypothetical protein